MDLLLLAAFVGLIYAAVLYKRSRKSTIEPKKDGTSTDRNGYPWQAPKDD